MKKYVQLAALMLSLVVGALAPTAWGGVFVSEAQTFSGNSSAAVRNTFFRDHLGTTNPVQWALNQPGTISKPKFFSSEIWQNISADYQPSFTGNQSSEDFVIFQSKFGEIIDINNKASSHSLDVKGNLGEALMDDFYRKDGWEAIDGKRGRQGIDGLYVKRDKNGRIKDFIIADSKTGSSKLQMTQHEKQLSQEWCRYNLEELLKKARMANPVDHQRVADLEQILTLFNQDKGRKPRVFTAKMENGVCVMTHTDVNGEVIGKPYRVNMRGNGWQQNRIYKVLEENIAKYAPDRAAAITAKIREGYASGKIQNDSDLHRAIKEELPDKKVAAKLERDLKKSVSAELGTQAKGKLPVSQSGGIVNATAQAGAALLMGVVQGGWSADMLIGVSKGMAIGYGLDQGVELAATQGSRVLVKEEMKSAGKKLTEKSISKAAGKLAPKIAKVGGSIVAVGFAGWEIYGYYQQYSAGNMSGDEFAVHSAIVGVGGAASAAATWAVASTLATYAAVGSWAGPLGVGAGALVGLGALAIDYFYTQHKMVEKLAEKQKVSENEKKHLAEVEEKRRQEAAATEMKTLLENEAAAWQILLAH